MKPFAEVLNIKISRPLYPVASMEGPNEDLERRKQFTDSNFKPNLQFPLEGSNRVVDQSSRLSPSLQKTTVQSIRAVQSTSSDEESDQPFSATPLSKTFEISQSDNQGNPEDDQLFQVETTTTCQASNALPVEDSSLIHPALHVESTTHGDQRADTNTNTCSDDNKDITARTPLHLQSVSHDEPGVLSSPASSQCAHQTQPELTRDLNTSRLERPDSNYNKTIVKTTVKTEHAAIDQGIHSISSKTRPQHETIKNPDTRDEPPLVHVRSENTPKESLPVLEPLHDETDHSISYHPVKVASSVEDVKCIRETSIDTDDSTPTCADQADPCTSSTTTSFPPWTMDHHRAFVSAVFEIGLKHCSPSVIMDSMKNVPSDITREKTKSHLQKFRKTAARSLEEFISEYDDFMKIIESHQLSNHVEDDHDESSDKKPNSENAATLLNAALDGTDPDKLLGGTAAAYAAYSVAHDCPMEDRSNTIPYEAAPEDFPMLTETESKSTIGQSLMKVKGALEFMTEFVLKSRHGIPMKLDKTIPPFLKKEDVATILPHYLTTTLDSESDALSDRRYPSQNKNPTSEMGMYPVVPGYLNPYPSHLGYPSHHHHGYHSGFIPGNMIHQPPYGSIPPASTIYPYGAQHPLTGGSHFMGSCHPTRPIFFPPQETPTMAIPYPSHLDSGASVGAPYAPSMHGHHDHTHFPPSLPYHQHGGHDYPTEPRSSRQPMSLHHHREDHDPPTYYNDQQDYTRVTSGHSHPASSFLNEPRNRDFPLSSATSSHGRDPDPEDMNCRSPGLRTVFDNVTPTKATFHRGDRDHNADESTQGSPGRKFWIDSSSKKTTRGGHDNFLASSPIHIKSPSKKKRAWSPSPNQEDHSSKRSREAIFRIDTTRKTDGQGELERPSSTLSFNIEELGLRPVDGTPMSNSTASPVTTVLRDMMWAPLTGDASDHNHTQRYRDESEDARSQRNMFSSPGGETHDSTPDRRSWSRLRREELEVSRQSSTTPVDRVALDFGMKVLPPSSDEDHH